MYLFIIYLLFMLYMKFCMLFRKYIFVMDKNRQKTIHLDLRGFTLFLVTGTNCPR